jgi:rod shape determining protein RodA
MTLTHFVPSARVLRQIDWLLVVSALVICALGIAFVWSASIRLSQETGDWAATGQPLRQAVWLAVSLAALVLVLIPNYTFLMRFSYPLYLLGILLLVGLFFQPPVRYVHRWYRIGGVLFQPSEYMKVILILTLSRYLMYRENYRRLRGLIGPFILTFAPLVLVVREPDLGTAMVFLPILFSLLYVAGARRKHLVAIILCGLALLPLVYFFVLHPYQQERVICFINPGSHMKNMYAGGFQVMNSVCAVGSGGVLGKGWGQGPQNLYGFIPADLTDFIFAVLAEEWGFVGAMLLLVLYYVIILCGLGIAQSTREPFGRLVAVGVVTMFAAQAIINIGMTIQLMPVAGLPLPFMSYGGSSLLSGFIALGLLINVGKNRIPVLADEDFK